MVTMKIKNKYFNLIALLIILFIVGSNSGCIKADTYAAPGETFYGTIYDSVTGKPMQFDQNEARIQVLELSYKASAPTPNPDFYANDTGYFYNSRLFTGKYNINIIGPFVPMAPQWPTVYNSTDPTKNIQIQGVVKQDYTVSPILEIRWVTPPVYNPSDSSISATITVSRGNSTPPYSTGAIKNINLYITGNSPYPGDASYDGRYTVAMSSFPANATVVINGVTTPNPFAFGNNYIVKSQGKIPAISGSTWWARVGASTATSLPVVGTPYNYTNIQAVTIK